MRSLRSSSGKLMIKRLHRSLNTPSGIENSPLMFGEAGFVSIKEDADELLDDEESSFALTFFILVLMLIVGVVVVVFVYIVIRLVLLFYEMMIYSTYTRFLYIFFF